MTCSTTAAGCVDNNDKEYYEEERDRGAGAAEVGRAVLVDLRLEG